MLEEHTVQDLWSWDGPLRARCDHYLTSPEFTAQGLLLGPRIRILRADCTKAAATPDAPSLGSDALDGDLSRARALLSVAYGYPISPWQMSRLQAAAAVTGQRPALAGIILAHAGLSRIPATPALAERLYHAEKLLDSAALSPIALLDALDLLPDDWAIHKNHRKSQPVVLYAGEARKFNDDEPRVPPGCPQGRQFTCDLGSTSPMLGTLQSVPVLSRPYASCLAASTAVGAMVGAGIGAVIGGGSGGLLGGVGGTLIAPGVGTISGAVLGGEGGVVAGTAVGAGVGGTVGSVVGTVLCSQGEGPKFGNNGRENRQADDARREAERKTGRRFSRYLERVFHDRVTGRGYSYQDLVDEAVEILNEKQ